MSILNAQSWLLDTILHTWIGAAVQQPKWHWWNQ